MEGGIKHFIGFFVPVEVDVNHLCVVTSRDVASEFLVFVFKQKTAYEVPKRDWSSDCALPILVWNDRCRLA